MTAPSVREALGLAAGILQDMIQRGQIVVGITGTNAYYIGEGVMPTIAAALATPPAPTPSAARERIARIVDPMFRDPLALSLCEARTEKALAKADAILALLPDAAAIRADERKMCLSIIENLRIAGATNFKDARHSGQRGADFCDALHDAYQAIRAAGEK